MIFQMNLMKVPWQIPQLCRACFPTAPHAFELSAARAAPGPSEGLEQTGALRKKTWENCDLTSKKEFNGIYSWFKYGKLTDRKLYIYMYMYNYMVN